MISDVSGHDAASMADDHGARTLSLAQATSLVVGAASAVDTAPASAPSSP